ncbi:LPS export ABC transporter periplasmic protein LptC [Desulfosarcina ovata]|uniref:LPS export ABC transporter periplasmic protein LptC n=1 Tax=Desulfosarcina ovata subsp. ovata TaxID=2752305 RepID=A0A5K8A323_9BACT|nr:LPS export ABC transporter periplasmic protein LptC [Desulfosarcina ovata]BBO86939.1 hypothetical protein DSCOOX_01190 [Desulfosarcina ovata subsp. ovata]
MTSRRLIQRLLLAVVVVSLIAIVTVFIGYRRATHDPEMLMDLIQKKADMHLDKVRQTASKNGIREWHMEAQSATLLEKEKIMQLVKPDVEFFMEDGDNVFLTADHGAIHTNSNRITVSGRVSANNRLYRFKTETLDYDPEHRELRADTPVVLSGESFTLRADRMAMNLDTRITHFEGGVEGIISEDLQL